MATKRSCRAPIPFEVSGGTPSVASTNGSAIEASSVRASRARPRVRSLRPRCSRLALAADAQSHVPARRGADPQQGGLHVGPVPRRGQGQERLQALPARLRSAVRLRSAALRSVGPALQSRRPGAQPDARQADAGGRARRRPALRDRLRLLQDHLQLDRAGRAVRRSGRRTRCAASKSSPRRSS